MIIMTSRYCKKNETTHYISKTRQVLQSKLILDFKFPELFLLNNFFYSQVHKLFVFAFL